MVAIRANQGKGLGLELRKPRFWGALGVVVGNTSEERNEI